MLSDWEFLPLLVLLLPTPDTDPTASADVESKEREPMRGVVFGYFRCWQRLFPAFWDL